MSIFLERIKAFAEKKKISLRQLSMSVGLSGAYLSNSLKQGSAPSIDIISKIIEEYPDLNPSWLLTGKGKMIFSSGDLEESDHNSMDSQVIDDIIDKKIDIKINKKLEDLGIGGIIRELIINEMEDELERAKNEMDTAKDNEVK